MANKTIRQKTHNSVDKIIDKAEHMRERSNEEIAYLKEKAIIIKENVDGYIKKNPEKSVLIAAGIGVVIGGIIVATIMRRKH